jgi:hypothetical protein
MMADTNRDEVARVENRANNQRRQRTERKKIQDRLAQRAKREKTRRRASTPLPNLTGSTRSIARHLNSLLSYLLLSSEACQVIPVQVLTYVQIAALEEALSGFRAGDDQTGTSQLVQTISDLRENNTQLRSALGKIQGIIGQVVLLPEGTASKADGFESRVAHNFKESPFSSSCATKLNPETETGYLVFEHDIEYELSQNPFAIDHRDKEEDNVGAYGAGIMESSAERHRPWNDRLDEQVDEVDPDAAMHFHLTRQCETGEDSSVHPQTILAGRDQTNFAAWNMFKAPLFDLQPAVAMRTAAIVSDVEKWHVGNSAYFGALDSVKRQGRSASTMDLEVALKAGIYGWEHVGHEADHPVWSALRQVDQRIFGSWTSKAQRIAMMYVCQTLIQYRESPTAGNLDRVPGFLRPR